MFEIEQTHFWFEGKRAFIAAMLNSLPKRSRAILDIGSGTGATTAFLSSWGHVTGLEYSPQARKLAKQKGIHLVAGSANKLPFANRSFDLVTYCDVLYHKGIDEHRALTHAYRVL
jgi:ubiquinone/menaquinone biosynthesis C-methylase UbiE